MQQECEPPWCDLFKSSLEVCIIETVQPLVSGFIDITLVAL